MVQYKQFVRKVVLVKTTYIIERWIPENEKLTAEIAMLVGPIIKSTPIIYMYVCI